MLEETETENDRLFCRIFVIGDISMEGPGPQATPMCKAGFVLEMRKILTIHWLVQVWVRNHPGQKQRLFLPIGNKFKFGHEGARRLR